MDRQYIIAPSRRDWVLSFVEGIAFFFGVVAAFCGEWLATLVLGVVSVSISLKFHSRGVFLRRPLLELNGSQLVFRQSFYIPTRVQNIDLNGVKSITIAGPLGDRRFIFSYKTGSIDEVRPYLRDAEHGAIEFLKNNLTDIEIYDKPPPGLFDVIRGAGSRLKCNTQT